MEDLQGGMTNKKEGCATICSLSECGEGCRYLDQKMGEYILIEKDQFFKGMDKEEIERKLTNLHHEIQSILRIHE